MYVGSRNTTDTDSIRVARTSVHALILRGDLLHERLGRPRMRISGQLAAGARSGNMSMTVKRMNQSADSHDANPRSITRSSQSLKRVRTSSTGSL